MNEQHKKHMRKLISFTKDLTPDNIYMGKFINEGPICQLNCNSSACLLGWCSTLFKEELEQEGITPILMEDGTYNNQPYFNELCSHLFGFDLDDEGYYHLFVDYLPNNPKWLVKNMTEWLESGGTTSLTPTIYDYINESENEAWSMIEVLIEDRKLNCENP